MDQQQLKVYEHQLEQVRERIALRPDDGALREVEGKLLNLIDLYKSLRSSDTKGPKTRLAPSATEPRGGEKRTFSRSGVTLKIGESCQALNQEGEWAAATIQSVSADRQHATVIFSKSSSARHCSWQEVREPPSATVSGDRRQGEAASTICKRKSQQVLGAVEPPTKAIGQPGKRSRPSSKTEYIRRKEEEHREKQDAWKNFSKKFGLGAAKPSSSRRP